MKYSLGEVKRILREYSRVTEPEIILGFRKTIYEITIASDLQKCSLSASNQRFDVEYASYDDIFEADKEILGICLKRDWDEISILRCVPDLSDAEKVIERYQSAKQSCPTQGKWSKEVLEKCLAYLRNTYESCRLFEGQSETCFKLEDGSYLELTYVQGLHGIVVEIAENEKTAGGYYFEDADILYEGFDSVDTLRLLKDCISDCWNDFRRQVGQT